MVLDDLSNAVCQGLIGLKLPSPSVWPLCSFGGGEDVKTAGPIESV